MGITIKRINRIGLWFLLIVLTVTLLVFPIHLTLEYFPVQSTRIFVNLHLFAILFCVWLALLLLLLFSKRGEEEGNWEELALVCIFSAVFLGFWTIITYSGGSGEGINTAAYVRLVTAVGRIQVGQPGFSYFGFPSLSIIGSFVNQSTGLDAIRTGSFITFFQAILLAALLYVLYRRFFNNASIASLAVLFVIQGNIWIDKLNIFHPRNLGLILLIIFMLFLFKYKESLVETVQDIVLMLILVAATTITHFVTSFLLFFIVVGIYVVKKLDRKNAVNAAFVTFSVVLLVFPLAWSIYWANLTFGSTIRYIANSLQEWIGSKDLLWLVGMLGRSNFGASQPLWSNIARLCWWIVIYGFGSILWMWNLFQLKKLSTLPKRMMGVLLGIIIVGVISIIGSTGGERFDAYILYGAFGIIPILFWFLLTFRNRIKKYTFICLVGLFFVLSLPTFLSHNNTIETSAFYPDEHAAGKFLNSNFGEPGGNNGLYFLDPMSQFLFAYYVHDTYYYRVTTIPEMKDEAGLWTQVQELGSSFDSWMGEKPNGTEMLFLFSTRPTIYYEHFFGTKPYNPGWQIIRDRISYHNKIYDSDGIQLFSVLWK